ncbi:LOW QUALITY PROTEIN: Attractin [Plecturocebus cupreus]
MEGATEGIVFLFLVAVSPTLECSGMIMAHCSLKLLDSRDPPSWVSQSAGITGVSHCRDPISILKKRKREETNRGDKSNLKAATENEDIFSRAKCIQRVDKESTWSANQILQAFTSSRLVYLVSEGQTKYYELEFQIKRKYSMQKKPTWCGPFPAVHAALWKGVTVPKPIALEPCFGNKAAVLSVFVRLPRGLGGIPPPGQSDVDEQHLDMWTCPTCGHFRSTSPSLPEGTSQDLLTIPASPTSQCSQMPLTTPSFAAKISSLPLPLLSFPVPFFSFCPKSGWGFTMLVRLVLNSQSQVICPPWPPKCLDYRHEPPRPAWNTVLKGNSVICHSSTVCVFCHCPAQLTLTGASESRVLAGVASLCLMCPNYPESQIKVCSLLESHPFLDSQSFQLLLCHNRLLEWFSHCVPSTYSCLPPPPLPFTGSTKKENGIASPQSKGGGGGAGSDEHKGELLLIVAACQPCAVIIPILQMRKLKHRAVKEPCLFKSLAPELALLCIIV